MGILRYKVNAVISWYYSWVGTDIGSVSLPSSSSRMAPSRLVKLFNLDIGRMLEVFSPHTERLGARTDAVQRA